MKAFICILVLAASANAGILIGDLAGGGGGYSYGGGALDHGLGHGQEASIIKVIHEQSHHDSAPAAIIKVIHEEGGSSGGLVHHQHIEAAPQIVQVIHEDHGHSGLSGHGSFSVPAQVVHLQVIHEQAGGHSAGFGQVGGLSSGGGYFYGNGGHDHGHGGAQEVKILKVIQEDQGHHHHEGHGWA